MSKDKTATCASCVYFDPKFGNDKEGECRFDPPKISNPDFATGYWPIIKSYNWCGKYSDGKLPWEHDEEKPA